MSARILSAIEPVLDTFQPHLVLVHGDTTTSSMVALAAFHKGIKVGHVEAGLRTYNKLSPFPEEINRQITGRIVIIILLPHNGLWIIYYLKMSFQKLLLLQVIQLLMLCILVFQN